MSYYRICPRCGAHLDPGETCDCNENAAPVLAHEDGKASEIERSTISVFDDIRIYGGLQA